MKRAETTPRTCIECGGQFVPRSSTHSFCSPGCKAKHHSLAGGWEAEARRQVAEDEERARRVLEELGVETWEQFVALDADEIESRGASAFSALDLFTVRGNRWPLVRPPIRPRGVPNTE
jgi:endogenous inhibitor of DNA gyrase (YacG/DUF329 family)